LGIGPVTRYVVSQPLEAFRIAAHYQQDWSGRVCHRNLSKKR
jgi:hypothetical protein